MCCDLLQAKGFCNIICRGQVNAPDKGVDIEADEQYKTLFGYETKHWIFQCKHMRKQVDRRDIPEILFLLKEFKAQNYGIFYTNLFTPNTIDRFKSLENDGTKVQLFDINFITALLNTHFDISEKYFGMI